MRLCPNMLLIGAADRNVGKTEFACALIRRYAGTYPVMGIKITTIADGTGTRCPRGGAGCGVCSALSGRYCITDEREAPPGKDTGRMYAAGASRVYWLRTRQNALQEGLEDLLRRIPADTPVVCESNSAREVIEPGGFLVIRRKGSASVKASCQAVLGLADRIVEFDEAAWNYPPDLVVFSQGQWAVREQAAAIVLAGGNSRRMGRDKSLLPLGGKPMIVQVIAQLEPLFAAVLIGANAPEKYRFLKLKIVPDHAPGQGPLMGLVSCLEASPYELNFVTACDIPSMQVRLIRSMLRAADGFDVVIPVCEDGNYEPLYAVYRKTVLAAAKAVLQRGGRRIVETFDALRVRSVPLTGAGWYLNLNTRDEYRAAAADWKDRRTG